MNSSQLRRRAARKIGPANDSFGSSAPRRCRRHVCYCSDHWRFAALGQRTKGANSRHRSRFGSSCGRRRGIVAGEPGIAANTAGERASEPEPADQVGQLDARLSIPNREKKLTGEAQTQCWAIQPSCPGVVSQNHLIGLIRQAQKGALLVRPDKHHHGTTRSITTGGSDECGGPQGGS
jgi:hypothetical protein